MARIKGPIKEIKAYDAKTGKLLFEATIKPPPDYVNVVRCRDCVNWAGDPETKPEYAGCWRYGAAHAIIVHENGFCDKGMRRDNHG